MDINELTQAVATHLSGHKNISIVLGDPPSEHAVGQVIKAADGSFKLYVSELTGIESRWRVLLHELAHVKFDDDGFIPVMSEQAAASIKRSQAERDEWRAHPREERAERLAREWDEYAKAHAPEYWMLGYSAVECRLMALLNWR